MKIAIGSDHAGFETKQVLIRHLKTAGYQVEDVGTNNNEPSDYPIYGEKVAQAVASHKVDRGIVVCGNGIGMAIVANKVPGVRAALVFTEKMAKDTREHNNTNVLSLAGRDLSIEQNVKMADVWLKTEYTKVERHERRIAEIEAIEKKVLGQ